MIGDEARVTAAFRKWLERQGWVTTVEVGYVDVIGRRADQILYAEVKGRTSSPGLDVDTLYGQLLRRAPADAPGSAILAVVVPDTAVKFAERVPAAVRAALGIHIYGVDEAGGVTHVSYDADPAAGDSHTDG